MPNCQLYRLYHIPNIIYIIFCKCKWEFFVHEHMYNIVVIYYGENDTLYIWVLYTAAIYEIFDAVSNGKKSEEKLRRRYGRKPTGRNGYNILYNI